MKPRTCLFLLAACGVASACASPPAVAERGGDAGAAPDLRAPDPLAPYCGQGAPPWSAAIGTQADLVAFADSLPSPVTLPCLLAALPRPIAVVGSSNLVSAQPAAGPLNPRLFIRAGGGLILSVTLAGTTSTHLETAEPAEPGYSVKGDMAFPRDLPISERDFYADIVNQRHSGTICAGCHPGEHAVRQAGDVPAFASRAMQPTAGQTVPLALVRALVEDCATDDPGLRCQMLRALFRAPDAVGEMQFLAGTGTWF